MWTPIFKSLNYWAYMAPSWGHQGFLVLTHSSYDVQWGREWAPGTPDVLTHSSYNVQWWREWAPGTPMSSLTPVMEGVSTRNPDVLTHSSDGGIEHQEPPMSSGWYGRHRITARNKHSIYMRTYFYFYFCSLSICVPRAVQHHWGPVIPTLARRNILSIDLKPEPWLLF
jgi:hypothetical protein